MQCSPEWILQAVVPHRSSFSWLLRVQLLREGDWEQRGKRLLSQQRGRKRRDGCLQSTNIDGLKNVALLAQGRSDFAHTHTHMHTHTYTRIHTCTCMHRFAIYWISWHIHLHRMTPLFGSSAGWSSRRPSMMHHLMSQIAERGERPTSFEEEWQQRMSVLELIDVAIDMRPAVPYLVSQMHTT